MCTSMHMTASSARAWMCRPRPALSSPTSLPSPISLFSLPSLLLTPLPPLTSLLFSLSLFAPLSTPIALISTPLTPSGVAIQRHHRPQALPGSHGPHPRPHGRRPHCAHPLRTQPGPGAGDDPGAARAIASPPRPPSSPSSHISTLLYSTLLYGECNYSKLWRVFQTIMLCMFLNSFNVQVLKSPR